MKTLENICRDFLEIGEDIPVHEIIDFARNNEGEDLESFFLINFQKIMWARSLNDPNVFINRRHVVLAYEEKSGRYGDYYILYCKIPLYNEYMKLFSNRKLNRRMENTPGKLIHERRKIYGLKWTFSFFPGERKEYKGIIYREIIF